MHDRLERLTDRQRECLRLIGRGLRGYEISEKLGISETAVTERLRDARRTLGVSSSIAAARLLEEHEAGTTSDGDSFSVLAPAAPPARREPSGSGASEPVDMLQEAMAPYIASVSDHERRTVLPLPVPTDGRRRNDLTWYQKLAWGLAIAFLAIAVVGAMKALQHTPT